ncbi:MAG: hypothetical protein F6K50_03145 [Moorea sp. SIO3I7]|uniref:hypothetical protein n=1 Tax=unclassified Moorena TaxID=2683338 RepID=UPI0013BF16BB|nr:MULTISPECIES: hypothetical protein [unclassified Moorena]NEN94556.1 hypothetical protein [Moorena sp. SIO3I7]NEO44697.1 hypothetical protein [Moorena sp. SIO4A3]NEO66524.1 hypothetical protein [Moorena sp. SIO4G2]NEO06282.1 hypothetical protein [Moorena sp. SIO3I8]NEO20320.1 hypothetical protein [Moorena sp. SIO4A5]
MKKLIYLFIRFLLFGFGLIGFLWLLSPKFLVLGAHQDPEPNSLLMLIGGYITTTVGVVLGSGYRELQRRIRKGEATISPRKFLKYLAQSTDLWLGLFGSPLAFALLWNSIEAISPGGLVVTALENGFCCTILVNSVVEPGPPTTPSPPAEQ